MFTRIRSIELETHWFLTALQSGARMALSCAGMGAGTKWVTGLHQLKVGVWNMWKQPLCKYLGKMQILLFDATYTLYMYKYTYTIYYIYNYICIFNYIYVYTHYVYIHMYTKCISYCLILYILYIYIDTHTYIHTYIYWHTYTIYILYTHYILYFIIDIYIYIHILYSAVHRASIPSDPAYFGISQNSADCGAWPEPQALQAPGGAISPGETNGKPIGKP